MVVFNQGQKLDTKVGLTSLAQITSFVTTKVGA
jgi:hypothetical protein